MPRRGRFMLGWASQSTASCSADADVLPIPEERLVAASVQDLLAYSGAWHDQPPCWQGEATTLRKMADRLRGYRLDVAGAAVGYCLTNENGESLVMLDVGINPQAGAVTAGRTLLQALAAIQRGRTFALNNVPVDSGLNRALAALHFLVGIRQFEMRIGLTRTAAAA